MKKLFNLAIIIVGCAILAVPIVMAATGLPLGSFEVYTSNATITKAVANIGGVANAGSKISETQWAFDLGGAPAGVPVNVRILGVATGGGYPVVAVSGDVEVKSALCRDKSNRQRSIAAISGVSPADCYCDGLTPAAGDKLVIRVTGAVAGAATGADSGDVF